MLGEAHGNSAATDGTLAAAEDLAGICTDFLSRMTCYGSADCIVSIPPSDPTKAYNLPRQLAKRIGELWNKDDLSDHVQTVKTRDSVKGKPLTAKLDTLLGTIEVDQAVFYGKRVLLIDDLYQSGVSMNYCGLLLLNAGASKIFGLASEKTCRNDDNVNGRI
jgi:predicted amidophosphoribosyltransferase